MGYVLSVGEEDVETKVRSRILIGIIEKLYNELIQGNAPKKAKRWFQPSHINDKGEPCGNWKIKKSGMAAVILHLNFALDDLESVLKDSDYWGDIEAAKTESEREEMYEQGLKDINEDILFCHRCVADALAEAVLKKKKYIRVKWI